MTYIYIAVGSTGEHADRDQWNAAAFLNEKACAKYVAALNALSGGRLPEVHPFDGAATEARYDETIRIESLLHALDPLARVDYNGTVYRVDTVPMGLLSLADVSL
jgi:hypothetical protein